MTALDTLDVVYIGCTESGFDICSRIHRNVVPVSEIVTLTPELGDRYGVAGYYPFAQFAEREGIDTYVPEEYAMGDERDVDHFRTLDADVLLVHGWQRLIPGEILETFTYGAFGLHGSTFGLPKGRGRSPMNWSLIEGLNRFLLSVIHLDEGVDSGAVVATTKYDINAYDDIRTLYYKLTVAGERLFESCLTDLVDDDLTYEEQDGEPTYYPKRTPEDGAIHWEDPTEVIHGLVRAVTRPYPGAFTRHEDERIYVWEAHPFSDDFVFDADPGEVVWVFAATDDFVVKTADGSLLVREWDADSWTPKRGDVLESLPNDSIGSPNRVDRPEHEDSLSG